mgnify:FL=1
MKLILLLLTVFIVMYLVMMQLRSPGADQEGQGKTIYSDQIERAQGVEQLLQDEVNKRFEQPDGSSQ